MNDNRALISLVMRLRFAMTARRRFALNCTGSWRGAGRGTGRARRVGTFGVLYAGLNVGRQCDGRHVVKRFSILPVSPLNQWLTHSIRQFVSRRSILPTGNLATLC
ncbi:hypothetical protein MSAS_09330 [Mycobacterium saskatchewanense]|nr:hypothetical protein MSAS_09330 [Mycobacterium saskatchewanense]